jgi:hypothetical protein
MADPADFVKDQFPVRNWPTIPTILRTAYAAANEVAKSDPIFQIESAQDNKGRLVAWAVDFGLKRAIDNGSLPCDYRWKTFAKPTGRYLELRFSHSTASVSQVQNPKFQPRNVVFRENARLRSRGLFETEDEPLVGAPHFLIVHGHQDFNFAHIGVPSSASRRKWAWRSQNLLNLPHEIVPEGPSAEDTDVDLDGLNLLKEDIERWRRENGDT